MIFFVSAAVLLGVLIFVHELGHFLVAKLMGVGVVKFSLGFGPKIIGKKIGETEYQVAAFPLGGFIKMIGEEPGEELAPEDKHRAFNLKPPGRKFAIVFAGPFFNIAFAVVVFAAIFSMGVPALYPTVGKVLDGSPAMAAGIVKNDTFTEVDGMKIESWADLDNAIQASGGKEVSITLKRGQTTIEKSLVPVKKAAKDIFKDDITVWSIGVSPNILPVVGVVKQKSPAMEAGLKPEDRIQKINNNLINTWEDLTAIVQKSPDTPLLLSILREGSTFEVSVTPERKTIEGEKKDIGLIGITPSYKQTTKRYSPGKALQLGLARTIDATLLTFKVIEKLINKKIDAKETVGGPIFIVQAAGHMASRGLPSFLTFLAIISVNLGIINLFPIPILDGGHLMFFAIESVRRKPLSEKMMIVSQKVGLAIILTLMAFVFYVDIARLVSGKEMPW